MVSFTARLTAAIMHAGILSGFTDEDGHSKKKRSQDILTVLPDVRRHQKEIEKNLFIITTLTKNNNNNIATHLNMM